MEPWGGLSGSTEPQRGSPGVCRTMAGGLPGFKEPPGGSPGVHGSMGGGLLESVEPRGGSPEVHRAMGGVSRGPPSHRKGLLVSVEPRGGGLLGSTEPPRGLPGVVEPQQGFPGFHGTMMGGLLRSTEPWGGGLPWSVEPQRGGGAPPGVHGAMGGSGGLPADSGEAELELAATRHHPEGLEQLLARTQFTKRELQSLYRGFKNVSGGGPGGEGPGSAGRGGLTSVPPLSPPRSVPAGWWTRRPSSSSTRSSSPRAVSWGGHTHTGPPTVGGQREGV